jgi:uncharacterized protein YjbI with pentapeptide repeats
MNDIGKLKDYINKGSKGELLIPHASITGANLREMNLQVVDLQGVDLSLADLSETNLTIE